MLATPFGLAIYVGVRFDILCVHVKAPLASYLVERLSFRLTSESGQHKQVNQQHARMKARLFWPCMFLN